LELFYPGCCHTVADCADGLICTDDICYQEQGCNNPAKSVVVQPMLIVKMPIYAPMIFAQAPAQPMAALIRPLIAMMICLHG